MAKGNINIIGTQGSGKTTYFRALASLPQYRQQHGKNNPYTIQIVGTESDTLLQKAEKILFAKLDADPTFIGGEIQSVDDLLDYSFDISVKKHWFFPPQTFRIVAKDYPGEVFDNLLNPKKLIKNVHQGFLDELFVDSVGCMIMLTGWEDKIDNSYRVMMENFINLMKSQKRINNFKLAIAMSKCERGEIWTGRLEPEIDLFQVHLPKTRQVLREKIPAHNLRFFAISSFGVISNIDPRPNRTDISWKGELRSVLREPSTWKPYNLIEPLYWLNQESKLAKS